MMAFRRGSGDALLIATAVAVMAIILGGITFGLATFFGKGYDFRMSEADALRAVVIHCLEQQDMFAPGFVLESCGLDSALLEEEHLIALTRDDGVTFGHGVSSYAVSCFLKGAETTLNAPQCVSFSGSFRGHEVTGTIGSAQRARRIN